MIRERVEDQLREITSPTEKIEIPAVKNLAQLKRTVKAGMEFEITDHTRPEYVGEKESLPVFLPLILLLVSLTKPESHTAKTFTWTLARRRTGILTKMN